MSPDELALLISGVSLLVAGVSLGWNIFRDLVLKSRVRVGVRVVDLVQQGAGVLERRFEINVVNLGPGPLRVESMFTRRGGLWKRLTGKMDYYFIVPDPSPLSAQLPRHVNVGERISISIPLIEDSPLSNDPQDIGVADSFGRYHWAKREQVKKAVEQYRKTFPAAS